MSKQERNTSSRLQREMSEQLIAMFGFCHPQILSIHLDRMFYTWNASDEADDQDMRQSLMMSLQMMKDFFHIFAKRDPEVVAALLKKLSDSSNPVYHEEV